MKAALITFGNEESYGLLFVGGELLEHKQEIRFFDAEMNDVVEQVVEWGPQFVMFSPMTAFYPAAIRVAKEIKNRLPETISVFGGHHAMACPKIVESDGIDVVVVGPVRGSVDKILGGEKGVIHTIPTTPADLPTPARREYYRDVPRMADRYRKFVLSMIGCPWNCSYCSSSSGHIREIFGADAHKRYYLTRRPIATVIDEAKEIIRHRTYEIEWVDDDVFAGSDIERWLPEFVKVWEKEIGLPMYVSTTSALTLKVSDNVLSTLKRIVNVVGMGVQAIRPSSLKLFNRGWDSEEQMKRAYDRLRSFGYAVNLQCIVGLPVDDPVEDAMDTIKGMQRIGAGSICSCYPLMIYPGTAMEKYCRQRNIKLNETCVGDTNAAIPNISFAPDVTKQLRNVCKLGTLFVKYNIDERWMRALINIDFDDETSRQLSMVRYYECVTDRLKEKGVQIFNEILAAMNLRY
jgi:radical SAM superfamily enzyme YgiQ (UPF0313 family)